MGKVTCKNHCVVFEAIDYNNIFEYMFSSKSKRLFDCIFYQTFKFQLSDLMASTRKAILKKGLFLYIKMLCLYSWLVILIISLACFVHIMNIWCCVCFICTGLMRIKIYLKIKTIYILLKKCVHDRPFLETKKLWNVDLSSRKVCCGSSWQSFK